MIIRACICISLLCLTAALARAQDIEANLTTSTSGSGFTVRDNTSSSLFTVRGSGRTGVNTATPAAGLHLVSDDGLLATGTLNSGSIPATGPGVRLMWYPKKGAFRAGGVYTTQWDDPRIGMLSMAAGWSTIASGENSVALGRYTTTSGKAAFAIGENNTSSGDYAVAMGYEAEATSSNSFALGLNVTASNFMAIAMGHETTASGLRSVAIGYHATADGGRSVAIGSYVNTNGKSGCFIFGDASSTVTMNATKSNRMYARFDEGYVLYTNYDRSTGMFAFNGANSWTSFSDSTRKEHYRPADAERMLTSFRDFRLGSWNYKGDSRRHYGPMAQEWFAAFGNDGVGTIGDDTTLATADVDGVLCIAVQALEQRTATSRAKIKVLSQQLRARDNEIAELRQQLSEQRNSFEQQLAERDSATEAKLEHLEQMIQRQDIRIRSLVKTLLEEQDVMQKRLAQQSEESAQ